MVGRASDVKYSFTQVVRSILLKNIRRTCLLTVEETTMRSQAISQPVCSFSTKKSHQSWTWTPLWLKIPLRN